MIAFLCIYPVVGHGEGGYSIVRSLLPSFPVFFPEASPSPLKRLEFNQPQLRMTARRR